MEFTFWKRNSGYKAAKKTQQNKDCVSSIAQIATGSSFKIPFAN